MNKYGETHQEYLSRLEEIAAEFRPETNYWLEGDDFKYLLNIARAALPAIDFADQIDAAQTNPGGFEFVEHIMGMRDLVTALRGAINE